MKKHFLLLTSTLLLLSCASIIEGDKQEVDVALVGAESAECTATSEKKTKDFTAPAKITLNRSYYPAEISCSANGQTGAVRVLSDVANWGYGGAALGIGVGAVVDASTGAAFEYPSKITITMGETQVIGKTKMNSNKDFE